MSSRSPSPPRRTVITSNSKLENSSNAHVEDLVKLRSRKLVELYCVSRLSELLEITDEKSLKVEIESFLRQNDIRKGLKFQPNTLPKYKQVEPPIPSMASSPSAPISSSVSVSAGAMPSTVSGLQSVPAIGKKRVSVVPVDTTKKGIVVKTEKPVTSKNINNIELHRQSGSIRQDDSAVTNGTKRHMHEDLADNRPEKKIKSDDDAESPNKATLDSNKHGDAPSGTSSTSASIRSVPTTTPSVNNLNNVRPPSISTSPAPSSSHHPVYYVDMNIPPAEPTPIETDEKFKNYLVNEVTKKAIQSTDYFYKNNVNSKESVYLLMKEVVPSKIAQALPLAELKYMIQTLPLIKLIPMAHKALTTDIMNNALSEGRITVVSSRIEELRRLGLWSLRQPKKFVGAWENQQSHYRTLIEEAKWMQADFKEGQKYKMAVCTTIAYAVMEYWTYGKMCCVKTKEIDHLQSEKQTQDPKPLEESNADNNDNNVLLDQDDQGKEEGLYATDNLPDMNDNEVSVATMDKEGVKYLEGSGGESEDVNDDGIDLKLLLQRPAPSEEITPPTFPESSRADYERHLKEGPLNPFKLTLSFEELNFTERTIAKDIPLYTGIDYQDNGEKELPFVPISKSMVNLEDDHFLKLVERQLVDDEQSLVQLSKRRGMFYGNRRSHYLKPPSAPSLRYLQNRTPTIWLPEDDQELVKNINAYAYNWELISAHMTHRPSMSYLSNIERRTPWQCFERFVQLNERFNFNDLKGPRAHSVQQWLMEAHKFQQKQNRRISPLGVGPESIQRGHRRLRWASMFEAIRKCIKKRENAPRPNPTQPRKPLDCKNMKVPTPAEMSQLKAQRDEALRRDIQIRRNVKSRLQQQSDQMTPNQTQMRGTSRGGINTSESRSNTGSSHGSAPPTRTSAKALTPSPAPLQKRFTEREIIESYSRKILAQKPELSLETAMKAAQSYYKSGQQKKLQQQQQKQELQQSSTQSQRQQPQHTQPQGQLESQQPDQKLEKTSNNLLNPNSSVSNSKIKSPTPQEILQRFQK